MTVVHTLLRIFVLYVGPLAPAVIGVWAALTGRSMVVAVGCLVASAALLTSAYYRRKRMAIRRDHRRLSN